MNEVYKYIKEIDITAVSLASRTGIKTATIKEWSADKNSPCLWQAKLLQFALDKVNGQLAYWERSENGKLVKKYFYEASIVEWFRQYFLVVSCPAANVYSFCGIYHTQERASQTIYQIKNKRYDAKESILFEKVWSCKITNYDGCCRLDASHYDGYTLSHICKELGVNEQDLKALGMTKEEIKSYKNNNELEPRVLQLLAEYFMYYEIGEANDIPTLNVYKKSDGKHYGVIQISRRKMLYLGEFKTLKATLKYALELIGDNKHITDTINSKLDIKNKMIVKMEYDLIPR